MSSITHCLVLLLITLGLLNFVEVYCEPVIRINCGGGQIELPLPNGESLIFDSDISYSTPSEIINTTSSIDTRVQDAAPEQIYQTQRTPTAPTDILTYSIPVEAGQKKIVLHFVELDPSATLGTRIFRVNIDHHTVLEEFDIFALIGTNAALTETFMVEITETTLTLEFISLLGNLPTIAGIEIYSMDQPVHAILGPDLVVTNLSPSLEKVEVSGLKSYTTAIGGEIVLYRWYSDGVFLQDGTKIIRYLGPGVYSIVLEVMDNYGNTDVDFLTITVVEPQDAKFPFGNPRALQTPSDFLKITTVLVGPDHRVYIGNQRGQIRRYQMTKLDGHLQILNNTEQIFELEDTTRSILGLNFDPYHNYHKTGYVRLYVSHSQLYHGNNHNFNGMVSRLDWSEDGNTTQYDAVVGLPVSNHDHSVNQIEWKFNGELLIQVGGSTNAGIASNDAGGEGESVFSAATLVAYITKLDFDGGVSWSNACKPGVQCNADQIPPGRHCPRCVEPTTAVQRTGFDVEIYCTGQRNSYDLVQHSNGLVYATDNGPNSLLGGLSINCTAEGDSPHVDDELNILVRGGYYGHPVRARADQYDDPRQCVWHSRDDPPSAVHNAPIASVGPSSNGIIEYPCNIFDGSLRGQLIVSRHNNHIQRVQLSDDGQWVREIEAPFLLPGGLDMEVWHTGELLSLNYREHVVYVYEPVEFAPESDMRVISVFPRRGPCCDWRLLQITGNNFALPGTRIHLGQDPNNLCEVENVTADTILCRLPAQGVPGTYDLTVQSAGQTQVLTKAYTVMGEYVTSGEWIKKAPLPIELGEVSCVVYQNYIFITGGHITREALFRYNRLENTWTRLANQTAGIAGDHAHFHVLGDLLYLFGGFSRFEESPNLSVYDIATDSWSSRANLTLNGELYPVGSGASGIIRGKLYVAGGISGKITVKTTFVYDPTDDIWTRVADMPGNGVNHAASVVYQEKLYVFGGRCCDGNNLSRDADQHQTLVYDPLEDSWEELAPMPTARGGMGNAVEVNGKLLVFGGEIYVDTIEGIITGDVVSVVEAYDPVTDCWIRLPDMQFGGRHGIDPVVFFGNVHVIGGGDFAGKSRTVEHDVYQLPRAAEFPADLAPTTLPPITTFPTTSNPTTTPPTTTPPTTVPPTLAIPPSIEFFVVGVPDGVILLLQPNPSELGQPAGTFRPDSSLAPYPLRLFDGEEGTDMWEVLLTVFNTPQLFLVDSLTCDNTPPEMINITGSNEGDLRNHPFYFRFMGFDDICTLTLTPATTPTAPTTSPTTTPTTLSPITTPPVTPPPTTPFPTTTPTTTSPPTTTPPTTTPPTTSVPTSSPPQVIPVTTPPTTPFPTTTPPTTSPPTTLPPTSTPPTTTPPTSTPPTTTPPTTSEPTTPEPTTSEPTTTPPTTSPPTSPPPTASPTASPTLSSGPTSPSIGEQLTSTLTINVQYAPKDTLASAFLLSSGSGSDAFYLYDNDDPSTSTATKELTYGSYSLQPFKTLVLPLIEAVCVHSGPGAPSTQYSVQSYDAIPLVISASVNVECTFYFGRGIIMEAEYDQPSTILTAFLGPVESSPWTLFDHPSYPHSNFRVFFAPSIGSHSFNLFGGAALTANSIDCVGTMPRQETVTIHSDTPLSGVSFDLREIEIMRCTVYFTVN